MAVPVSEMESGTPRHASHRSQRNCDGNLLPHVGSLAPPGAVRRSLLSVLCAIAYCVFYFVCVAFKGKKLRRSAVPEIVTGGAKSPPSEFAFGIALRPALQIAIDPHCCIA